MAATDQILSYLNRLSEQLNDVNTKLDSISKRVERLEQADIVPTPARGDGGNRIADTIELLEMVWLELPLPRCVTFCSPSV